jgi:hypothetical protein
VVNVSAGLGGAAAVAGRGGQNGDGHGRAADGAAGRRGSDGKKGTYEQTTLTAEGYPAAVRYLLGGTIVIWAHHRLACANYLFRRSEAGDLAFAKAEYAAAQRLDASLGYECNLRISHIDTGVNAIGFSRDLDVYPDFEKYVAAFGTFGNLLLGVFNAGNAEVLHAIDAQGMKALLVDGDHRTQITIKQDGDLLDEAITEKNNIQDLIDGTSKKMEQTRQEIEAAKEEMKHHDFTFGDVVRVAGKVAEVAGAVVSVILAVPSGGASLLALIPDAMALSKEIVDDAPDLVQALFKSGANEVKDKVEARYHKGVGADIAKVDKATKSVVSLINVIEALVKGKTPSNEKSVALVQRGLELAHQLMLQQRQVELANMRCDSLNANITRGKALSEETNRMINSMDSSATTLRKGGLEVIRTAQLKIDHVQAFAYRALRAAEIYTLKDESSKLSLDAGHIHPDIEADYLDRLPDEMNSVATLVSALTQSWSRLIGPVDLEEDYQSYWSSPLLSDIKELVFRDGELKRFKESAALTFSLEPDDFDGFTRPRFDIKIVTVYVALVGAAKMLSCTIEHGSRYTQKRRDESRIDQLLRSRRMAIDAHTTPLRLADVSIGTQPPLTTPQAGSFWGRGVCGQWELTLSRGILDKVMLDGLSEIEVWVAYQFQEGG